MCGIVALHHKNAEPIQEALLKKMADRITHRGPDDEGVFIDAGIGFYHKRLSIIDLETGQQPMSSGPFTIVYNGEIYNYIELRQELIKKGCSFHTHSDTEVILNIYEVYGEEGIGRLNGMFAFILYDKRNQRLLIARDHFGIKPLYYYQGKEKNVFASEIKALLVHPEIPAELDQHSLNEYLTFQFVLGEATLFKGIKKLLPGHYLVIDLRSDQSRMVKYWTPDFSPDKQHSSEYFIYELQRLLEDTVKIQLRSDVPLGIYLSGGMDSSIIALLASRHLPGNMNTFTGLFREGPAYDESRYSDLVAERCGARVHKVIPTEEEFTRLLPQLIYYLDEPVSGPGLFPQYIISKAASEKVKVVLGGQGGDELFGGYARYTIAYLEQAIKDAIMGTSETDEQFVSLAAMTANLPSLRQYIPLMRRFWKKGAFENMDRRYFHLIDRSEGALALYSDDFRAQFDKEKVFAGFQEIFNAPKTSSYYNKMTHFDMFASLPGLLQVEDRMSMAVSLESRVPLLDKRIVDLVTAVPAEFKFKGGEMKYLLKKAVQNILPNEILQRKDKMGFPLPLHPWIKSGKTMPGFIRDILLSDACRQRGIFDPKSLEHRIEQEQEFGRVLWGALSIELWFREFIDN